MQTHLEKLYQGEHLSQIETKQLFNAVMHGEIDEVPLASAIISMKVRGESTAEISGAVLAALDNALSFATPDYAFADIVGTGGDNSNSINISTMSAFVAAALGLPIAKHGNRSVSSKSGSADILAALGINLDMSATEARTALDQLNICFLFAPKYHSGFKHAAPIRSQLKTRTIFNLLGPLVNPANPSRILLGVYDPQLIKPIIETLQVLNYQHALVVHGSGLDEVAVHGATQVAELKDNHISYYQVSPTDFGLETYTIADLEGGDAEQNAKILKDVLQGRGQAAHKAAIIANVAMLMRLFGYADLNQNAQKVRDILQTDLPFAVVTALAAKGQ